MTDDANSFILAVSRAETWAPMLMFRWIMPPLLLPFHLQQKWLNAETGDTEWRFIDRVVLPESEFIAELERSSTVEQSAVNRQVAGSNPAAPAKRKRGRPPTGFDKKAYDREKARERRARLKAQKG